MRLFGPTGMSSSCAVLRLKYPTSMRVVPSASAYQPSYAPVMLEPRSRTGLDNGNGLGVWLEPCCPARTRTLPTAANAISSARIRRGNTLMGSVGSDVLPGALRDLGF